ncbi:hypothetical protein ACSDR0_39055 [Streptosporangium sp. G11]|uniref:hypothetical protein n=1 Tax=Streptosporangium sp. G11 TaxID=3436926 RepID=UPI003EBF505C
MPLRERGRGFAAAGWGGAVLSAAVPYAALVPPADPLVVICAYRTGPDPAAAGLAYALLAHLLPLALLVLAALSLRAGATRPWPHLAGAAAAGVTGGCYALSSASVFAYCPEDSVGAGVLVPLYAGSALCTLLAGVVRRVRPIAAGMT